MDIRGGTGDGQTKKTSKNKQPLNILSIDYKSQSKTGGGGQVRKTAELKQLFCFSRQKILS